MADTWRDVIAGDRLAVDQEFDERVRAAGLSPQEWGLVMTAVEFEIEEPGDPEAAELVADTSKLGSVLPEMERVRDQVGGGTDAAAAEAAGTTGRGGGGILDAVRRALGLGGDERRETAEQLAAEYAERLQDRLRDRGRWEDVCAMAAD
ncbi:MAG: DUF5799 family protein [Halobacteriaceae archaeon]